MNEIHATVQDTPTVLLIFNTQVLHPKLLRKYRKKYFSAYDGIIEDSGQEGKEECGD